MSQAVTPSEAILSDPDCLRCMHRGLNTTCLVVFFGTESGWRLSNFQGEQPSHASEALFTALLDAGVPDLIAQAQEGLIANTAEEVAARLPTVAKFFDGQSLIAAPVTRGRLIGVRLAWRSSSDPFTAEELQSIQCFGDCPGDCCR